MGSYKHIEHLVGEYIARNYSRAVEAGVGRNTVAAEIVHTAGALMRCTDIRKDIPETTVPISRDDLFEPDLLLYQGADVIYAIRPAAEMVPPLMEIAHAVNADLIVYHLGFEMYGDGGERIDCGVILHRYVTRSEPVKEG